jgi:hypothetical protein
MSRDAYSLFSEKSLSIVGPALSGTLVNSIGFEWMLFGIAILNFIYAPFMYFLRAPPTKEEKKVTSRCAELLEFPSGNLLESAT